MTGSLATQATLRFTSAPRGTGLDHFDIGLDGVSVRVVPVPEPATIALFGAGLAGLGALRRRRKAKAYTE